MCAYTETILSPDQQNIIPTFLYTFNVIHKVVTASEPVDAYKWPIYLLLQSQNIKIR